MTGSSYLLDSNIIIEIFSGNKTFANKINTYSSVYIPVIVAGELQVGVNRVSNKTKHQKKVDSFLQLYPLMNVTLNTTKHYGLIVAGLFKKGKPIPINDVWIAAIALEHNLTVITQDQHFAEIEELKVAMW